MSHSAAEINAITTQPLISPMNITEPNTGMEIMANIPAAAKVITTQPMMNDPTDEEQEEKKQQREDDIVETIEVAEDCMWCCFNFADCARSCNCTGCDNGCDGCGDCCNDCGDCCNDCGDCCTGCCEGGPSDNANIDGDDIAGCVECCGACFECCSND